MRDGQDGWRCMKMSGRRDLKKKKTEKVTVMDAKRHNGRKEFERECKRECKVKVMWMSTEQSCCSPAERLIL